MSNEQKPQTNDEGLDELDQLLKNVIQPIIGKEFSEKINENEGFQDGKKALQKIREIDTRLDNLNSKIEDLVEDDLENLFNAHSIPPRLPECADDIFWKPDPGKETENDNSFSMPIIKIRDNLLHPMNQEVIETFKTALKNTESLYLSKNDELNQKLEGNIREIQAQQTKVESQRKELQAEQTKLMNESFEATQEMIHRQSHLIFYLLGISCVNMLGFLFLLIFCFWK